METLVQKLQERFELKLNQRQHEKQYGSSQGVLETIIAVFEDLENAFENSMLGEEMFLWKKIFKDESSASLYVRSLKENNVIRSLHCSRISSTSNGIFTLECVLPDSSLGHEKTKIGSIEVLDGYSVLKEFGSETNLVESYGLGGDESDFTREKFEEFIEKVLMYEV